jgi:cyanophycinase-like exopeptidase
VVGLRLDEDTAVLIDRKGMLEVLGSNMVTLIERRASPPATSSGRTARC